MDEESLFAFQPPAPAAAAAFDSFAHLTQPTQLQTWHAPVSSYYPQPQQQSQQRPMTAPTYSSEYHMAYPAVAPQQHHPQPPLTFNYALPDEPSRPATSSLYSPQYYTPTQQLHPAHYSAGMATGFQPQRRISSAYPFSHDPFPSASTSRPTTADARMLSSRQGTAVSFRPDTASSSASTVVDGPPQTAIGPDGRLYQFVGLQSAQKKRARRRFDEIERMYGCLYPGCTKAYGVRPRLPVEYSILMLKASASTI
jgi:hypothetical protein